MTQIWFKAKKNGYGWTPATWQGWTAVAVYGVFNACNFYYFYLTPEISLFKEIVFTIGALLSIAVLLGISYKKGEKLAWRWGNK